MKIRSYKDFEEKGQLFLELKDRPDDNCVLLRAVDECGDPVTSGIILKITEDGVIMIDEINPIVGLPTQISKYGNSVVKVDTLT